MSENMVYGGAILSAASLIVGGILIAAIIYAENSGLTPGSLIYILPVMAVLVVAGVFAMLYGSKDKDDNAGPE
ncbi:hypothetical protein F1737_11450 [Methanoplanus sp. FWC-SCC4]|uniref:Uncharacterized protein n=1 Tax=Methanochimaera problematica TaxID=2609417 RepID=A0AA97I4S6_9EURY|nr:hypothetical protein [Methanoplanus sp. FWC-SCC4]WOF17246.1 hypothetical protein F1737_11450 [Methanoplanus sp. FWC-SCC4]